MKFWLNLVAIISRIKGLLLTSWLQPLLAKILGTVMKIPERQHAQLLLEQQLEQQRLVMEMTNRIIASLHLPVILQTTVHEVRQFLQTDRVIIFQFFANFQGKVVVESCGENWTSILSTEIYDPCFHQNYIEPFKQGLVTAKSDIYTAGISECHLELLSSFQVRANLAVPILQDGELWGLLIAHHCETSRQWQDSEIDLLKQIASGMSIALKQSALVEKLQTELNERQQTQQTLAKELLRTQTLFDTSFDGIVIMDKEGNVLDANPRFAEMLGYTPEEILRLTVADWEAQLISEELQQLMKEAMINNQGILETQHQRKDGSIYDVEISYNVVEWEGEILRFCVCRDISLRKQAEEALKRSRDELEEQVQERTQELLQINNKLQQREREFRTLVENTPDIITRHDRQYRYLYINPASIQQSRIPTVGYLGKKPSELSYPKEITDFWEACLENVFTTGRIRIDEFQIVNVNEAKTYQTYIVPEFGDGESVESVITIARDITKLRKAEESARQLAEDLKRSNEELEQFAYIASHDLQEPLRAVASFTQMLAKRYRGQLDSKADTYIEFIIDGATRMQQMIQDLLSYSRVGRTELKLQSVDCNLLLERVKKDLQISIRETQAVITADSLPTITADANQLGNLLQNLINNSLKYRSETFPKIHISAKKNKLEVQLENLTQPSMPAPTKIQEEWLFSIQDNGIGIKPQYAERIFGIFQRLHTSDEYPGTGLGLAICRKILERHEGRIWVESNPNQGSTFFFTIPVINYTQHEPTSSSC